MAIDIIENGGSMSSEPTHLSRRESQIMEIVYELGRATAADIREAMPDPPSYSAVRAMLRILEDKGHLRHEQDGPRYVYLPTIPPEQARASALKRVVRTFFDGSAEGAVSALLDIADDRLDQEALERIADRIEDAKKEGR
jgi:predicted transcriptional regulator